MLLCSSSDKTFAKINLFCFGGSCGAIGKKGGNIRPYPKPKATFSGRNKKIDHKLSKVSYFIKISYAKTEFTEFFWQKSVIFTPAKTTRAASQLHLLGIKQRDSGWFCHRYISTKLKKIEKIFYCDFFLSIK